jgi:hypothetical protein
MGTIARQTRVVVADVSSLKTTQQMHRGRRRRRAESSATPPRASRHARYVAPGTLDVPPPPARHFVPPSGVSTVLLAGCRQRQPFFTCVVGRIGNSEADIFHKLERAEPALNGSSSGAMD